MLINLEIYYTQGAYFTFQMGKGVHDDLCAIILFRMPCVVPAPFREEQGAKASYIRMLPLPVTVASKGFEKISY